jgi:hypothetical protein
MAFTCDKDWEMEGDLRAIRNCLDEYLAVIAKADNGSSANKPPKGSEGQP